MNAIRLAVLSDLHAYVDTSKSSNSSLAYGNPSSETRNPLSMLIAFVKKQELRADVVVCPGDICNQADFAGFSRAWAALGELKCAMGASEVIATCGNHDLDSRYLGTSHDDPDPKGELMCLNFPFDNVDATNKFWAKNYCIVQLRPGVCAVVLNTSAYHGGKQGEIDYGRVSRRTITSITHDLKAHVASGAHILVCHHHLIPMQGWESKPDYQYVLKGAELLDALEEATGTSWLVIHGHRHTPRLMYGPSSSSATPIIFGAGSLGAQTPNTPNLFTCLSLSNPLAQPTPR